METIDIRNHTVSPSNVYLFDTNIWIYIFGPVAGSSRKKQSIYTKLFREIIERKARILVPSLVLSEYINAVLRMKFNFWKREKDSINANFKTDYRTKSDYATDLKDVLEQVNQIMTHSIKQPDNFHQINIVALLDEMYSSKADYNDIYITKMCEGIQYLLVSDDRDIQNINARIKLITCLD